MINIEYRVVKVVICQGHINKAPYINHILIQQSNGVVVLLDKGKSEEFIRVATGTKATNAINIINLANNIGNIYGCLEVRPYINPSEISYNKLSKCYNAIIANYGTVNKIGNSIKEDIKYRMLASS